MDLGLRSDWLDDFVLARHHDDPASQHELRSRAARGDLFRVVRGVYVSGPRWRAFDDRERHLTVMRAAVLGRMRRLVFSHWSAAAAWGLPIVGMFPSSAHVVDDDAAGGRSDDHLVRHCVGIPQRTWHVDGLEVTSLARTVTDLARVSDFRCAVVAADAALSGRHAPRVDPPDGAGLWREAGPPGARGSARARRVAAFADGRSGSPGESISRCSIHFAGLTPPVLQQRFDDAAGSMFVDFWWPQFNVMGEFDGLGKYVRKDYRDGRSTAEVVIDEKWREDRLRALTGARMVRWGKDVARSPRALAAHLRDAGVR